MQGVRKHSLTKFAVAVATGLLLASVGAAAGELPEPSYVGPADMVRTMSGLKLRKDYALGINRFDLDAHTEIIGWRISDAVYFGRQDGLDSGLTLVWQQQANQLSLSKDGVRLTRRF